MSELTMLLMLDPYASNEQIQAAYNQRRAALIALEASDPAAADQLRQLDTAFTGHVNQNKLALSPAAAPRPPLDPALQMVGSLTNPIVLGGQPVEFVACPYCSFSNPAQSSFCGSCGRQISRPCPNCGKQILLNQAVCPRCGVIPRDQDQYRMGEGMNTGNRVQTERMENKVRVESLEASHLARLSTNIFIIIALVLALVGLLLFAAWSLGLFGGR